MNYRPQYIPMPFIELPRNTRHTVQAVMEYLRGIYKRTGHIIKFMGKNKYIDNCYWIAAEKGNDVQWIRTNKVFDTKGKYK